MSQTAEFLAAVEDLSATAKDLKRQNDQQAAEIKRLTSERDIFSTEAEHWRALAYKMAGANTNQIEPPAAPPAPMAAN